MNNARSMNDLVPCTSHEVDEIECFIDKNNCSTCGAPLRTTELTFPEHHLNEVMHTATDGRNGLFAPLLSRLRFAAIRGDSRRFVAIRGDLLISDTRERVPTSVRET